MAKITLDHLRHSYSANPSGPADYALKEINLDWQDGGAYALLGPSGCGKSTLLNIISGLQVPSEGRILFDGRDVTRDPPDKRNIAQVFQFPVIYDTMTVYDNLAFPLRNRGVAEDRVKVRVTEIAAMLEVTDMLGSRAAGLSPDNKQKISMGRGLVREDVNVVMFDEPLTVIDPRPMEIFCLLSGVSPDARAPSMSVTSSIAAISVTRALTRASGTPRLRSGKARLS